MALASLMIACLLSFQDPPKPPEGKPQADKPATQADEKRIDELVRDLTSASLGTRLGAMRELREIGQPAVQALQRAAGDPRDVERSARARALLQDLESGEAKAPARVSVIYEDAERGLRYERKPDGGITLRAPKAGAGQGEFETYTASSVEEFLKKHGKVVEEYDLHGLLLESERPTLGPEIFEHLRKELERLGRLRDEDWQKSERLAANGQPRLGVMVSPIPEALRAQLSLDEKRGLLVADVAKDAIGAQSGLQRHDVILLVDGKAVEGMDAFVKDVAAALKKPKFVLTIIRQGEARELIVNPGPAAK